ncbi:hypothetical protein ACN4EG_04295 [Alkalinema pantanalense CENA528]|uniref:hypothetical protein n=1 Tax=Alkalinema pantanalense TaxID=1620705 RepID=UPI003D6E0C9E
MSRFDDAVDALSQLNSREFGYLLSASRYAGNLADSAQLDDLQDALEQLTQGLAIVYLFAIFEDYFSIDEIKKKHGALDEYLAYRHIRHSFAHKPLGKRAKVHRAEFEKLINTGNLDHLLIWDQQNDLIYLRTGIVEQIRTFLVNSVARIAV